MASHPVEYLPPMHHHHHRGGIQPYLGSPGRSRSSDEEDEEKLDRRLEELQRELRHIKAVSSPINRSLDRYNRSHDRYHHGDEHDYHREFRRIPEHSHGGYHHVHEETVLRHGEPSRAERLAPLKHSPPGMRPSVPSSPSSTRRVRISPHASPVHSPPLPQETAWLPASPGSQMRTRELEEERERLLSAVHELEGKCHHYMSRLSEVEGINIDLERKLSDTIMDNSERIRVEHADHRRVVEEREHQIGVLRHECETERSVRNREVTSLKGSLENERRLLVEARAREEDTVNACRIKISELEADFSSREKILIDQRDEMGRSLRATIKRLENEVDGRVEDFRGREMVWEKVKGDIEGKLVELTAENARFRQEIKELRGELSETQERLRKAQRHSANSPSLPPSPNSSRPLLPPPPPWATHEGIPLTSAEHGSGIDWHRDSTKSWYASPKQSASFRRENAAAGKPSLSRRLANYMDGGIVGGTDRIIVRDSSRVRNLSPSLSLSEQCRQLEQQLMHCNAEKNALENALNKYPTNSAGRTLNERIDKREKEQRLASVELAISNLKAKLRDLDAL